jgi:hypothetical protein
MRVMNATKQWMVILVAALACTACKKKEEPKGDDPKKAVTKDEPKTAPAKAGGGIDDPANDKAVVAARKRLAAGEPGLARSAWRPSGSPAIKDGKGDVTLPTPHRPAMK